MLYSEYAFNTTAFNSRSLMKMEKIQKMFINIISVNKFTEIKLFNCILILLIFFSISTQVSGNQSIEKILSYHTIILAENSDINNSIENVVVDILKGKLDINSFNLLKESSGFAVANKPGGLFLFYIKINENGQLSFGSTKVNSDYTVMCLNRFNLLDLYKHLGLEEHNHTFPKFLDMQISSE